jgi:hypothetical protein
MPTMKCPSQTTMCLRTCCAIISRVGTIIAPTLTGSIQPLHETPPRTTDRAFAFIRGSSWFKTIRTAESSAVSRSNTLAKPQSAQREHSLAMADLTEERNAYRFISWRSSRLGESNRPAPTRPNWREMVGLTWSLVGKYSGRRLCTGFSLRTPTHRARLPRKAGYGQAVSC